MAVPPVIEMPAPAPATLLLVILQEVSDPPAGHIKTTPFIVVMDVAGSEETTGATMSNADAILFVVADVAGGKSQYRR